MLLDGLIEETQHLHESDSTTNDAGTIGSRTFGLEVARAEAQRLESLVNAARQRKLLPECKGEPIMTDQGDEGS